MSRLFKIILSLLTLLTGFGSAALAQKKVNLVHADDILFDSATSDAKRLRGSVALEYGGTMFYCDSAYLFSNQDFDAFSNIRVVKGADYSLTGDLLHFDKKEQKAVVTGDVILRDRDMTLTTSYLTYDLEKETAAYTGGGKIVSSRNKNVLTSGRGTYHSPSETFYFRQNVVLTNPEYTVKCDTLQYMNRVRSAIAYFFGPTTIDSEDTHIYCENGWYNTSKDICQFNQKARVVSGKTVLTGDSIFYHGEKRYGEVFRNVEIRDTTQDYTISGEYGHHDELLETSFVTDHALMKQVFENDTLFLRADTLFSQPDSSDLNFIRAYHNVSIYKTDLQGLADSLTYSQSDSTIELFSRPVLWSDENQITGDSIRIRMWEGHIDRMIVRGNSFIVSAADTTAPDSTMRYNQIRGRNTIGFFRENELRVVRIEGNGQLVYFPTEEKEGNTRVIGHNKGECSDIEIDILGNQIRRIRMLNEPSSTFSPMQLAPESEFLLDGFEWRGNDRPRR